MPWTPIRCHGRVYPNAPAVARAGCLERPPSYWFRPTLTGFNHPFFNLNNTPWPCQWNQMFFFNELPPFDPTNIWRDDVAPLFSLRVEVWTHMRNGRWGLELHVQRLRFGQAPQERVYRLSFANGFPAWSGLYTVTFLHDVDWFWGGAQTQTIANAPYAGLAPDICIF